MNDREKSHGLVVPTKPRNKTAKAAADGAEGRSPTKENPNGQNADRTQRRSNAPNALERVREAARKDYEYYAKIRSEIYDMRTWPFGISSSVQYATLFVTNVGAMVWKGVGKLIEKQMGL